MRTILPLGALLAVGIVLPALAQQAATTQPPAVEAQIAAKLAEHGYTDVSGVIQQGEVWIVQAKRGGRTETVTVDRDGNVSPAVPSDTGSVGEGGSGSGSSRRPAN
jgi:ABC-type transport system substrate-binding protein